MRRHISKEECDIEETVRASSPRLLRGAANEKHAFLLRPCNPSVANLQPVLCECATDERERVAIREEKPDGFPAGEIKSLALDFNPPGAAEMKVRHHALQTARGISFNSKTQFAVAGLHAKVEQKRQQSASPMVRSAEQRSRKGRRSLTTGQSSGCMVHEISPINAAG